MDTPSLALTATDPITGRLLTASQLVILKITWDSWQVVSTTEPGEIDELHQH